MELSYKTNCSRLSAGEMTQQRYPVSWELINYELLHVGVLMCCPAW